LRTQLGILPTKINFMYFFDVVISYSDRQILKLKLSAIALFKIIALAECLSVGYVMTMQCKDGALRCATTHPTGIYKHPLIFQPRPTRLATTVANSAGSIGLGKCS
jgi:hypothetical protein